MQQLHSMDMPRSVYVNEMIYWQDELKGQSWQDASVTIREARNDCMGWMNASFLLSKYGSLEAIPEEELVFSQNKYPDYDQKLQRIAQGEMPEIENRMKVLSIWEQKMDYGLSYEKNILSTLQSAQELRQMPEFSDPQSFAYRNTVKTEQNFEKILHVPMELVHGDIVPSLIHYESNLFFLLALILLTVLFLLQPIENGVESLLHTTPRGGLNLAVQRVSILATVSIGYTFGCSVELLFLGKVLYQQPFYFMMSAQNFSMFASWTGRNSVLFVLLWIEFFQSVGIFLAGLFIWLFLSQFRQKVLGLLVLFGFLVLEYTLYQHYGIHDAGYVWALINLFQLLFPNRWARRYYNFDIAGFPWNEKALLSVVLVVLGIIAMGLCFWGHIHLHEKGSKGKIKEFFLRQTDRITQKIPFHGAALYEIKKWMITSRGGLIVIAGILLLMMQIPSRIELTTPEIYYYQYLDLYHGDISWTNREDMEERMSQIQEERILVSDPYGFSSIGTADLREQEEGLGRMIQRYDFLFSLKNEMKHGIELADDRPYQRVWGEEGKDYRLICAVILTLISALLIPLLFGVEERGKMREMLFALSGGRQKLWSMKLTLTVTVSILSGLSLILMEIFQYIQCGGSIHDFTLSTQCFLFENDPLCRTTLFLFLLERLVLILLHMTTIGLLTFAISSTWSGYLMGSSISSGILFAPMLIETLGLNGNVAISAPANMALSVVWLKEGQVFLLWILIEMVILTGSILISRTGWKKFVGISFD